MRVNSESVQDFQFGMPLNNSLKVCAQGISHYTAESYAFGCHAWWN